MEVVVNITREDYWKFNAWFIRHLTGTTKKHWIFRFVWALLLLVAAGVLTLLHGGLGWIPELGRSGLGLVLLAAFGLLGLAWAFKTYITIQGKRLIMRLPAENSLVLGEHRIRIDEEGIHEESAVSTELHRWRSVTEVLRDGDYIFLVIDNVMGAILPLRAFASPAAAEEFLGKSTVLWKTATRSPGDSPGAE